jgi:hypothetical protein
MKNRIFIASLCLASLSIISCKNEESKPTENVNEQSVPENTDATRNDKLRTLKTGEHTVTLNSIQDWVIDQRSSEIPAAEKSVILEQIGYKPIYSANTSMATMVYRKGTVSMNADNAISGMIGTVLTNPNISVKDQKFEDVSAIYGFPAKLSSGRFVEGGANPYQYEYKILAIADGKELYMFLGMFETINGFDSRFFDDVLKSVKINKV